MWEGEIRFYVRTPKHRRTSSKNETAQYPTVQINRPRKTTLTVSMPRQWAFGGIDELVLTDNNSYPSEFPGVRR